MPRKSIAAFTLLLSFAVAASAFAGSTKSSAAVDRLRLTGTVKSESGSALAGVTVSAKAKGQTITTTVFTDEQGRYFFPAEISKAKYAMWAQTEGYQTARSEVIIGDKAVRQDFVLKTLSDFTKQMTGQEYLAALPEDTPQHRRMKDIFFNNCTGCHEASYILQNRFDAKGWEAAINLMSKMVNGGGNYGGPDQAPFPVINYYKKDLAEYLAEMRGPGPSPMHPVPRPGPTGEAAMAVITEYDLPIADKNFFTENDGYATNDGSDWSLGTPSRLNGVGGTHDTQMDRDGNLWLTYAQPSGVRSLGMVDAKTGKVTDIKVPGLHGMAAFTHGLAIDHNGILWFTAAGAGVADGGVGSLASIDPKTMKFEVYPPPKGMSGVTLSVDEDAKGFIWASTSAGAVRFDPKTHQYTEFRSVTPINAEGTGESYGVTGDREGNGWWTQMFIDRVGKGDVKSGKSFEVKIPPRTALAEKEITEDDRKLLDLSGVFMSDFSGWWSQGPRRLGADKQSDVVWVGDYWGNNLAKIDIHTLKPTLYPYPERYAAPYDAVVDSHHNVWMNLFNGDAVVKFDPSSETWTKYPLPTRGIEMRHMAIAEHDGAVEAVVSEFRVGKVAVMRFRTKADLQALQRQSEQHDALAQK
jgi:streptogramin lyase